MRGRIEDLDRNAQDRIAAQGDRAASKENQYIEALPPKLQAVHNGRQKMNLAGYKKVTETFEKTPPLLQSVDKLKNLVAVHGLELSPTSAIRADMESTIADIKLIYKSKAFADLGVLNGPDEVFLEKITSNPGSFFSVAGGSDAIMVKLNNLNEFTGNKFKSTMNTYGFNDVEPSDFFTTAPKKRKYNAKNRGSKKPAASVPKVGTPAEGSDKKSTMRSKYGY